MPKRSPKSADQVHHLHVKIPGSLAAAVDQYVEANGGSVTRLVIEGLRLAIGQEQHIDAQLLRFREDLEQLQRIVLRHLGGEPGGCPGG